MGNRRNILNHDDIESGRLQRPQGMVFTLVIVGLAVVAAANLLL